jgi:hypothetical protein
MSLKIKLAVGLGALALGAFGAWYVCGLRAEVESLGQALTRSQAVVEQMEINLTQMAEAGRIVSDKQESAAQSVAAMNREIKQIKESGSEENTGNPVNDLLAEQLNRLFRR